MPISARGLALLRSFEGCELKAYRDSGGVLTIGFGHTRDVREGQCISQAMADEMLALEAEDFSAGVSKAIGDAPTTQDQFDAMVCLAYNIGLDAFAGSTVLRRHKQLNYIGAANAFLMWVKDGGRVVQGLIRRRAAEARLYRGEH